MNFMDNIQLKRNTFTKNEAKACDKILEDLKLVQTCSIQDLSETIGVTKTTIMRFTQKIGYSGYSEFKYAVINYVNSSENRKTNEEKGIAYGENAYADTIRLIHHTADEKKMKELAKRIVKAKSVYLAGMINSHVSAMQMYYSLLMFGIRGTVLDSSVAVRSVDMCVTKQDLVLIYSVSGKSEIMKQLAQLKESSGCGMILITSTGVSDTFADDVIVLPSLPSGHGSLLEDVPVYSVFNAILVDYISQLKSSG